MIRGPIWTVFGSTSRSARRRCGSLTPITAWRITSSVIARMRACKANGFPIGHRAASCSTICSTTSP
ncbi:MAG TPA: hypothetical protein VNZ05_09770 [Solirubrobacteraceae bacterium]|nr:hypothetical protein [Solirubrobacteraceae bacterium]